MTMVRCVAILILIVLLLNGCVRPLQPVPETLSWTQRRELIQQRTQFQFSGRMAIVVAEEGFTATVRWQQQMAQSAVQLNGPLGLGGASVQFDGQQLEVRNAQGEVLNDSAAQSELIQRLGFEPPFEELRYWLQGVPHPGSTAQELLDAEQRLSVLRQNDWEIQYPAYQAVAGQWLPARVQLTRAEVRVKVIIAEWRP
jgi:outer membrane lipoprotein LolB